MFHTNHMNLSTCYIAARLHMYELASIWGAGGDGGSVRAVRGGAEQETAVRDAVSTFVHVKPLDIFNEMSWYFAAKFMETELYICSRVCGYFVTRCRNMFLPCSWKQMTFFTKCLGSLQPCLWQQSRIFMTGFQDKLQPGIFDGTLKRFRT